MKHIPTLTLQYYTDTEMYGYEYDDENGLTQSDYGFITLDAALGSAYKRLKTFLVLAEVEQK
jgi:hypothetical protein